MTAPTMKDRWNVVDSYVGPDRKITREIIDRAKAEMKRRGWDAETTTDDES